jgi:hypothetical protein
LFAARPTTSPPDISGYAGAGELQTARPAANCQTGHRRRTAAGRLATRSKIRFMRIGAC